MKIILPLPVKGSRLRLKRPDSCQRRVVGAEHLLSDISGKSETPRTVAPSSEVDEIRQIIADIKEEARDLRRIETKLSELRRLDVERWEGEGGLESALGNGVGGAFRWLDNVDEIDEELLGAWKVRNKAWLEARAPLLTKGDVMKYSLLTERVRSLDAIKRVERMESYAIELQLSIMYLESEVQRLQEEKSELALQTTRVNRRRRLGVLRRRNKADKAQN